MFDVDISKLTLTELITSIIITYLLIMCISNAVQKILGIFNVFHKSKSKNEDAEATIESHSTQIKDMEEKQKKDIEELRAELLSSYQSTNDKLDSLIDVFNNYVNKDKKDKQVLLRDKKINKRGDN